LPCKGSMALKPFLRFRASRRVEDPAMRGSFLRLTCGGFLPPPHSPPKLGAAVSPTDKPGNRRRPPASHLKKASKPHSVYFNCFLLHSGRKLARRHCGGPARRVLGGVWGSSKGRMAIRRIRMELSAVSDHPRICFDFFC
jgi:hypothetical protein